jgi:hypothetical protein
LGDFLTHAPAGGLVGASLCCGRCGDIAAVIAALLRVIARPGGRTSVLVRRKKHAQRAQAKERSRAAPPPSLIK